MRVLLVIYGSLDQLSGGYLYDRLVVEHLRRRDVEVDTLELAARPYLLAWLRGLDRRERHLLAGGGGHDLVVVDELVHPSVARAASRRPRSSPPLVTLVHHLLSSERPSFPVSMLAAVLERRLLHACDLVIVNSRTTEQTVRSLAPRSPRAAVCPPGCDYVPAGSAEAGRRSGGETRPERRAAAAGAAAGTLPAGRPPVRLLATGTVIPRKGYDLLLPVLATLTGLPWRLRVVGKIVDRRYMRGLERLVRRHRLQDRVAFAGGLGPEELRREYRQADLFVFTSRYEGYGISVAEAMRVGLPVLAFRSGAVAEVAGNDAVLVAPGDLRELERRLRTLIADPRERERLAARARLRAERLPTWEQTGACFQAALREARRG